jgi:hypothetical protein
MTRGVSGVPVMKRRNEVRVEGTIRSGALFGLGKNPGRGIEVPTMCAA